MSDNAAINSRFASDWQLVAEFSAAAAHGGEQQLADQVCERVRELGLPPQHLERIRKTLLETVQRVMLQDHKIVQIRLWVTVGGGSSRGWGFFLLRKPNSEPESDTARADSLVELFLYQELIHS
jgi:hypothetical protein